MQQAMGKGQLTTAAYDQDDRTKLGEGTLLLVNNTINQSSGTIQLKATFPNENRALWPGEFVNVRLIVAVRHNGVSVPLSALMQGDGRSFVYVVGPSGTVEERTGAHCRDPGWACLDRSGVAARRHRGDRGSVSARAMVSRLSKSPRVIRACKTTPKSSSGML